MVPAFEIFRKDPEGRYIWCSAANDMGEANATLRLFATTENPASEFLILNQCTQERVRITLSRFRPRGARVARPGRSERRSSTHRG